MLFFAFFIYFRYPGSWSDLDFATGGAWLSSKKYGCEGYQLFGFDHGKDVTKLPSWVHSVTVLKGTTSFVGQNASNSSYLQDPNGSFPETTRPLIDR